MTDVTLELQAAVYDRLRTTSGVTAYVSSRVYDRVPPTPTFPYISFGPVQALSDDYECITGYDVTFQIDVWSREAGRVQALRIADQVRRAILSADLSLTDNAFLMATHRDTRVFLDPDGLTTHAVVIFSVFVEQA